MTPYIDKDDLAKHVSDINEHNNPTNWTDQIQFATDDVLNKIKSAWWPQVSGGFDLDESLLNTDALKNLATYCCLGFYALPWHTKQKTKDGDAFSRKAEYYRQRYNEEWDVVKELPLYDFDEDSQFDDDERQGPIVHELVRG